MKEKQSYISQARSILQNDPDWVINHNVEEIHHEVELQAKNILLQEVLDVSQTTPTPSGSSSMAGFTVQPYRRKYLDAYRKRMSVDNLNCLWDDNVASVLYDQGFDIKESPRSVYKVEKLYEALNKYSPEYSPNVDIKQTDIQAGIAFAYACFARNHEDRLELLSFTPEMVHNITSNRKGSAGLTAWGQTKAESEYRAYERGLQQIKGIKRPEPCIAFKRTQFDDKTRLVWGYPYAMTALEGIFARPLIDKFKDGNTPMAFGMQTGVLGSRLRVSSYHRRYAYSMDVKSFDSSASQPLIKVAFKILATWFDLSQIEPTSGVPYLNIWKIITNYFIHTPIVMPDGNVYKGKKHGVPSGSYFTQIVDSIVNTIYVGTIAHRFNLFVSKDDFNVLGDDVIFWSNRDVSLEVLANFGSQTFNVIFNAKKSMKFRYDQVIHYLGRDWKKGVPSLPLDEILIRMTQPETYRKYSKDPQTRQRQVFLLLMSYAAVYNDAYPIFVAAFGDKRKWYVSETNLEMYINSLGEACEFDSNFLSGLERYRRKYLENEHGSGITPLALQFWK
jgi:hypothetical protein